MLHIINESKCLASYAVFSELYNSGMNDIYDVIAEFIKEVIISNGKHQFTTHEMCQLLDDTYGFKLLENIIKSFVRRIPHIKRINKMYIVENLKNIKTTVESSQAEVISQNSIIIDELFSFIERKMSMSLTEREKEDILESFCSFLLEDVNGHRYSELISAYIIENQGDTRFTKQLTSIKEGVILYTGLKYNNDLNDLGSWRTNLTIF